MKRVSIPIFMACLVVLASCGDAELGTEANPVGSTVSSTTVVPSPTTLPVLAEAVPFLVIAETGGCFMMGPNCSTTLVMSDGSFGVFRTDPADVLAVPEDISTADLTGVADVQALARAVAETDFARLLTQLDPGTCQACFDGIDVNLRFYTAEGAVDLDSVTYSFDPEYEFFQHLEDLRLAIGASGALELMQRGS